MKTEKEKAAEGLLYNANHDSELQDEMKRAKCVLFKYNQLPPDQEEEKEREEHRYPIPFPMRLWL